jgi:hypothetical protein
LRSLGLAAFSVVGAYVVGMLVALPGAHADGSPNPTTSQTPAPEATYLAGRVVTAQNAPLIVDECSYHIQNDSAAPLASPGIEPRGTLFVRLKIHNPTPPKVVTDATVGFSIQDDSNRPIAAWNTTFGDVAAEDKTGRVFLFHHLLNLRPATMSCELLHVDFNDNTSWQYHNTD